MVLTTTVITAGVRAGLNTGNIRRRSERFREIASDAFLKKHPRPPERKAESASSLFAPSDKGDVASMRIMRTLIVALSLSLGVLTVLSLIR